MKIGPLQWEETQDGLEPMRQHMSVLTLSSLMPSGMTPCETETQLPPISASEQHISPRAVHAVGFIRTWHLSPDSSESHVHIPRALVKSRSQIYLICPNVESGILAGPSTWVAVYGSSFSYERHPKSQLVTAGRLSSEARRMFAQDVIRCYIRLPWL